MRLAILSDIHGNLDAFTAVLADIDSRRIDRIVSLGDNVGYGPRPEEVLALVQKRGIDSVMGNHEAGLSHPSRLAWFNPTARKALDVTRTLLSRDSKAYIASLPPYLSLSGARFVHGVPPDAINTYLFELDLEGIADLFPLYPEQICFVGHTHDLGLYTLTGNGVAKIRLGELETTLLDPGARHIVNAGAVGQPRDGDNRAKYLIFDDRTLEIEVRRVEYDAQTTAREIIALGIPEVYARRLLKIEAK